jgi:hypothetical protein
MDKKILIEQLHSVFCELNKGKRKYSEAWLSDVDFGGWYYSDNYELHVKTNYRIENYYNEVLAIFEMIKSSTHDVLRHIWSVSVHDSSDKYRYRLERDGPITVYNDPGIAD